MADTQNNGPSTSTSTPRKYELTREGSVINPNRPSKQGLEDTAERGGRRPSSSRANNSNNNTSGGKTPLSVSRVARKISFNNKKPKRYDVVSSAAKKLMKEQLPPNAERRLVRRALETKFGKVRIPSASPPNNSKALTVYTKPKSPEKRKKRIPVSQPNEIIEPKTPEVLAIAAGSAGSAGSASSENVPIIRTKVRKKRQPKKESSKPSEPEAGTEQKPRARRMRRPAKRESPKPKTPKRPKTPETETETKPSGTAVAVKKRSPTIKKQLPTNGQSTASDTKPKPKPKKKVGPITAVKKRSPPTKRQLPPNGQPKTVITVNKNSVEKIISAIKNSKPKSKTPPSVNIKRFLEPFKQPVSIHFAPTIQGSSSKSNATATQIQPDKSAKKKKPFKKFDVLADPASAYRKSVAATKRKEIMTRLRTPTVGQRKKHVIQLIDKELRLMKVPKDIERKMISLYSKALSEKQIKQLFGGRSAGDVKKILKKQVDYFKKKKR